MSIIRNFFIFVLVLVLMFGAALVGYNLAFRDLIFPRTYIAGVDVSGMDKGSAERILGAAFNQQPSKIILRFDGEDNNRLENFQVSYDFVWAVDQALGIGRKGNILTQLSDQLKGIFQSRRVTLPTSYDQDELEGILIEIANDINIEPVYPSIATNKNGVTLMTGQDGLTVDTDKLRAEIVSQFGTPGTHTINIPISRISAKENTEQAQKALAEAKKWLGKSLTLNGNGKSVTLKSEEVIKLFGLNGTVVNEEAFQKLLKQIKPELETEPKNAVFIFADEKVKQFSPEVVGGKIDEPKLREALAEALFKPDKNSLDVSMIVTQPEVTAGDINSLGIKELIGKGTSKFAHSISSRVFNIALASKRINGTLVAPGEEFSFNQAVGEISSNTGYKSAYIISGGKTVLGDGGGVCQVSTTTFRAALNAGLPITERKAHAYRVGYYEQDSKPGIDATVYNPTADLKFKNDTGNYILVQTEVDTKNLTMEVDIYGTSDGRKSSISTPVVTDITPPPPTRYVDDPTLPKGEKKQIDWSAWGAKVSFNYTVTKNGETTYEKTFYSNYQPWQAIYLVGTM